jgi:ParB family chromosome partitioning protein
MRIPWSKSKPLQLDLLSPAPVADGDTGATAVVHGKSTQPTTASPCAGHPLLVPTTSLFEDPNNPRTEFPEADLDELADSIRQHGILEPIVVHPANSEGRHRVHFGAMRLRAAQRAGLHEVPVVVRDARADPYAQFAENQKRQGLTPLDVARFIRARLDEGDSNADVARQTGMNLTTVAHHRGLLDLPPELDEAMKSGRCTSPRTLHELSQLYHEQPEQVRALVTSNAEITRAKVSTMRSQRAHAAASPASPASPPPSTKVLAQAHSACDRLERALERIKPFEQELAATELDALRERIADVAARWLQGV